MTVLRGIIASLTIGLATAAMAQGGGVQKPLAPRVAEATTYIYADRWSVTLPAGWTWHDEVRLPFAANGDAATRMMIDGEALPEGAAAIGFFPADQLDAVGLIYTASAEALFAAFAGIVDGKITATPLGGTGDRLALTAPYPFSPAPPPGKAQLVVYEADGAAFAFVLVANDFAPFADVARGVVMSTVVLGPIP